MAKEYGPVMLLHFGSAPVLVVSSADAAREILKTHDLVFADRPQYEVVKKLLYGCRDVAFSLYGDYWRKLRGIFVTKLLTNKKVRSLRYIREEETALFVKKVEACSGEVNLSDLFAEISLDGICRSAFGTKYSELENGKRFMQLMREIAEVAGDVGIGEFIPWLRWIDRVRGLNERVEKFAKEVDHFLDSVIEERLESVEKHEKNGDNFVDVLLEIYNDQSSDEASIDKEHIKAIILDIFSAGTETTSTALEWAMAELLRHPTVMEKLQREVREIVKQKHNITDDDIDKMQYLKAVVKETLRHHPPLPLLLPRVAREDVGVNGYNVSAGTIALVNVWAISRDPASWDDPEMFKPERFLESSVDFIGLDFELIPFGSGRRGCPGIAYAISNMELLLANTVHIFDWKLADGVKGKDLDMSESPGLTAHRATPLLAIATTTM